MRIFIAKYREKTDKNLNHLHHYVMIHPIDVNIFFEIVKEVERRYIVIKLC